ncbi:WD repeat-containing and planar cell polarity effector protein fritz isoform X1 [Leptidea sinapis]|uniref:WD repeat-containing and planar cell polarity effector protein fritz isoform X1 n=1 Tax=Leptidea sinapis TaxID=189913 RepID=UPI0021C448B2|nr:WD repeat-containing and planar cell polarity effector protein fritz isoform X1 [Leptidea sinapis]
MFSYDVRFFSNDDSICIKNNDLKSFKYETTKKLEDSIYDHGKRNYCERRGGLWRSQKVPHFRRLESKLRELTVLACEWSSDTLATLVFSTGAIAHITIKTSTLDITQILFDRYCVGKLIGQTVSDVVYCRSHILFVHPEKVATLVVFGKINSNNVPTRISDREPHLQSLELGGSSRRTERQVSSCENGNSVRILVWCTNVAEPAPWTPVIEDHANLHLYHIDGQQVSLIAYHQLESETLFAQISHRNWNIIHIVEQASCHKSGVELIWIRFDIPKSDRVTQLSTLDETVTHAVLPSPARLARRSPCDQRLLAACVDGSVHILHHISGLTHSIRAGFIATDVIWAGELVVVSEESGRLQCFDRALSLLHHHTKCLDLTSYFRESRRIQILATHSFGSGSLILAMFNGGPLSLLRINHPRLIKSWLKLSRPSNAIELLRTLDWETEGDECLHGISEVITSTLRRSFDVNSESAIQGALAVYLAPNATLPPSAVKYAPPVHDLARKFFHHLLRRGRIETAMSLAVELEAWDLFMDARWAASRAGLEDLAREAAACVAHYAPNHTDGPGSECSDSCSQCSSQSTDSEVERSAIEKRKMNPPPLPRVQLPPHPTIPVPITHNEAPSTTSIRPNLHQYLDKDDTIYIKNAEQMLGMKQSQQNRWNSVDVLNYSRINEGSKKSGELQQYGKVSTHFNHLFPDLPTYRFNSGVHSSNANFNERYRQDKTVWTGPKPLEKNKVKFSDTVTVAVVPTQTQSDVARELADSLPLCPPNKYLTAFTPQAQSTQARGHDLPSRSIYPNDDAHSATFASSSTNPPKIKVVHFGMV